MKDRVLSGLPPMCLTCRDHINPRGRNPGFSKYSQLSEKAENTPGGLVKYTSTKRKMHISQWRELISRWPSRLTRKELDRVTESDIQGTERSYSQRWTVLKRNHKAPQDGSCR